MDDPTYSADFYAQLFGVTQRHIRRLATDGIITRARRGEYPLQSTIRGVFDDLRRQIEHQEEFVDLRREQARKARAEAELLEAKLAIQRQDFVHVSVVQGLLERFASQASAIFLSAPSRIKNRLPHLKSRDINVIKKELANVSNAISEIRPH